MTSWFRSWHGAPTADKWRTVARRAGVPTGYVTATVWVLLDRASQAKERGSIAGYDAEVIADALGFEPEQVEAIIRALHDKGALEADRFTGWEKHQPSREDPSTDRVRTFRERRREQGNAGETQCNAPKRPREDTEEIQKREEETSLHDPISKNLFVPDAAKPLRGTNKLSVSDFNLGEEGEAIARKHGLTSTEIEGQELRWRNANLDKPAKSRAAWLGLWENWCVIFVERNPRTLASAVSALLPTVYVHKELEEQRWQAFAAAYEAREGRKPAPDKRGGRHFPADLVPTELH